MQDLVGTQSPSWETDDFLANQEIPLLMWN
jgi:hypothetical protein